MTQILTRQNLSIAIDLLKADKPVAIPTETVYGLAANALSEGACRAIFHAKGRPLDNPLIVHISSKEMLRTIVDVDRMTPDAHRMCDEFWPGPLTLVLPRKAGALPDVVVGGAADGAAYVETVAVRMPSHPLALEVIGACGFPLAAPSANTSGRPSPTSAQHVLDDLAGRIDAIVDGGRCEVGVESTVVDVTRSPAAILRPGGICAEEVRRVLPDVRIYRKDFSDKSLEERPSTPGMKYRHYSPDAQVVLVAEGASIAEQRAKTLQFVEGALAAGSRVAYMKMHRDDDCAWLLQATHGACRIFDLGADSAEVARNLFEGLRSLDALNVDFIVVPAIAPLQHGLAVMNRLEKAASQTI